MTSKNDTQIRMLVLDILKPHKPDIVEFGKEIYSVSGVISTDLTVYAVDEKTESVKLVIEGKKLSFTKLRKAIENSGGVVHSVDKVSLGKNISSFQLHELPHVVRAV